MAPRTLGTGLLAALLATAAAAGLTAHPLAGEQGPGGPGIGRTQRGPGGPMRGPGGRGGFDLPGLSQLELTDAQKEQIRATRESHRDEMRQVGERTREAQRTLDLATHTGTVDENDIRAKSTALAAAIADGAILRARVNAEILNMLTAEQKQQLEAIRAKMRERRQAAQERIQQRMERRQQLRGQ